MPHVTRYSRAQKRTSTTLISIAGYSDAEVVEGLLQRGVVVQAGNFYAQRATARLGLGEQGAVRIGLAPYNTEAEIDRLLTALAEVAPSKPATAATGLTEAELG